MPTIAALLIIGALLVASSSAAPTIAEDVYPTQPNEVLPIQPVLLYPKAQDHRYLGRKLEKDNEIIYVKLLKRKSYRPKIQLTADDIDGPSDPRELSAKDIFYVKALVNGQFSHHRVKWYRLPQFYAISVFRRGDQQL